MNHKVHSEKSRVIKSTAKFSDLITVRTLKIINSPSFDTLQAKMNESLTYTRP